MVPLVTAEYRPDDPIGQSTPIFGGDGPATIQAIQGECDEFLQTMFRRGFGVGPAMDLVQRWDMAMRRLSAEDLPPRPDVFESPRAYGAMNEGTRASPETATTRCTRARSDDERVFISRQKIPADGITTPRPPRTS
jgi:hypothetical protein